METRRTLMSSSALQLCATAALAAVSVAAETPALKSLAPPGLRIGVALNRAQSDGKDAAALAIVTRHFDQLSPENDLKWERVHPQPDRYDCEPADRYVEFGRSRCGLRGSRSAA